MVLILYDFVTQKTSWGNWICKLEINLKIYYQTSIKYNSINCDNEGDVESTENVISDSDETFFDF
jgi:hypothetical protein